MEMMPISYPIKWSCDYSRAWLTMVNVPARNEELEDRDEGKGSCAPEDESYSMLCSGGGGDEDDDGPHSMWLKN